MAVDGSCNGLQNLSAALLDPIGGAAVNLIPAESPQDIYGIVAKAVSAQVDIDAASGIPSALGWRGKVDRKVCKRPVMTLAYGAKKFGFADQIRTDTLKPWKEAWADGVEGTDVFPFEDDGYEAATYLASVLWDATGTTVVAAQRVMGWLQDSARIASKAGMPIRWHTPAGFPVMQEYHKTVKTRIKTMLLGQVKKLNFHVSNPAQIDSTKMANSIAPNWVHSHDAAHMMLTIERFAEYVDGTPCLHMVHDSYGTHACDSSHMYNAIRESFSEIYSEDVLRRFYDEVVGQVPPDIAEDMPPPPIRGSLDISQVLSSDYFFA